MDHLWQGYTAIIADNVYTAWSELDEFLRFTETLRDVLVRPEGVNCK